MPTRTRQKRTRTQLQKPKLYDTAEALEHLRKLKGIFKKGPKDPIAWQRKMRRDRKILK